MKTSPQIRTLAELLPGEGGEIVEVKPQAGWKFRLMELGLLPGTPVQMVRFAPLGDPLEIRVRGYSLSLRRSEVADVFIRLA